MATSLTEYMNRDMSCEEVLGCLLGLTGLDRKCYEVLVESNEGLTVDEVAESVDRERSTAYRAIQRLQQSGLVQKEQVNYDDGGYYHVYYPRDPEDVSDDMQRTLNDWYAQMGLLIDEFRRKYEQHPTTELR